jgi:hypothetical protein
VVTRTTSFRRWIVRVSRARDESAYRPGAERCRTCVDWESAYRVARECGIFEKKE